MKNILVPLDLSAISGRVLDVATELAQRMNVKLWLVHVAAPEPDFVGFDVGPGSVREIRADELRKEHVDLQRLASDLVNRSIQCEALLVQGPTSDTLLSMITRLNADMVVMGSHGHGALYKTFVGSISEQVLSKSPVPVVIVPNKD